jgi:hypothetical protein
MLIARFTATGRRIAFHANNPVVMVMMRERRHD